jgi:hypothetical protein
MKATVLPEPELEFGGGARHIDMRFGLLHYGPLDRGEAQAPQGVRLGIAGDSDGIDRLIAWIDRCRAGLEAKRSRRRNLYPPFPGFGDRGPFCDFLTHKTSCRIIPRSEFDRLSALQPRYTALDEAAERYVEQIGDLIQSSPVDLVLCVVPASLLYRIDVADPLDLASKKRVPIWHDWLKARCIGMRIPIQVIRPATFGGGVHRYSQDGKPSTEIQEEATRAWNFFTAAYYKAGGVPWRIVRDSASHTTCYMGVSFFRSVDDEALETSVAQVFNQRGEGVVVRGGQAQISNEDRSPHIPDGEAAGLVSRVLALYRQEHGTMPARIVCHKSSYFTLGELAGFKEGARAAGIDHVDLVSIRHGGPRLFRMKEYPPLRGTVMELGPTTASVYTQGSVDFYQCYPGKYIPSPLLVQLDDVEQSPYSTCAEILALTKMNWNSTTFVNSEPITLAGARQVGSILRYLPEDHALQARYSFYM